MSKFVCYISEKNEEIIYTETALSATQESYIFPTLCVTRILEGSGLWQIGSELCKIKAGDFVFLSNIEPRRIVSDNGLKAATLSFSAALPVLTGSEECFRIFYGRSCNFTHVISSQTLENIYDSVSREMMSALRSPSLVSAYIIELLINALREYNKLFPGTLGSGLNSNNSIAAAINASAMYISQNLTSDLKVKDLAKRAGMSTAYYSKMFFKYVSVSPADYIARSRIKLFLSTFCNSKSNIIDIAFSCGFNSSSGFYKAFHRICGCAPSEALSEKE